MSPHTDYLDEMPGMPISDADVEALLTRREPSDTELSELASALARIDLQHLGLSIEQRAGVFSLRAATLARQSGVPRRSTVPWWRRLRSKLVTSALSVFAVIGMTGVAVASNAASPGDLLYGIDKALERVGINDGGVAERLEEASTMADRGQSAEALELAANAVSSRSPSAAAALERAAQSLQSDDDVTADVASMLEWISSTDVTGRDFGQGVAVRARQLETRNDVTRAQDDVSSDEQTGQQADRNQGNNDTTDNPGRFNGSNRSDNPSRDDNGNAGGNGNGPPGDAGGDGNGNAGETGTPVETETDHLETAHLDAPTGERPHARMEPGRP